MRKGTNNDKQGGGYRPSLQKNNCACLQPGPGFQSLSNFVVLFLCSMILIGGIAFFKHSFP